MKYISLFGIDGTSGTIGQFGSLANGSSIYTDDPDVIQSLPAYTNGWSDALIENKPTIQDFNALIYLFTRQIAKLQQIGIGEWNSTTEYFIGSIVSDGFGAIYMSLIDNNLNKSITDLTKWFHYKSHNMREIGATTDYTVLNSDYILLWTLSQVVYGTNHVILPTPSSNLEGREIIVKLVNGTTGTSNNRLSVIVSNGSIINNPSEKDETPTYISSTHSTVYVHNSKTYVCDGNSWYANKTLTWQAQ